jgi:hypothetical protein
MRAIGLSRHLAFVLVGFSLLLALQAQAGLYGDEGKDVKSGNLNDQDYWWTVFDMAMLDLALQEHQPEGHIGLKLASTLRRLDDLEKKYPQNQGIEQWKEKAQKLDAQIDPKASCAHAVQTGLSLGRSQFRADPGERSPGEDAVRGEERGSGLRPARAR